FAGPQFQRMLDEIELQLKKESSVGDRGGRQPARAYVERHMPGVVLLGGKLHTNLTYNLRPHVKRRVRVLPRLQWQLRPALRKIAGARLRKFSHRRPSISSPCPLRQLDMASVL